MLETVSVDVPDPVTLAGLTDAFSPVTGTTERLTIPPKPFREETVIVDVQKDPFAQLSVTALEGASAKSWIINVTTTEWVREPLVPVTVTANVPAATLVETTTVKLDIPEVAMLEEEKVAVMPCELGTADNKTFPEKLLNAVTLIVDVSFPPAGKVSVEGFATTLKSGTVTVTVRTTD